MTDKHSLDILDKLIEFSHTAPELCPSCKYFENEFFEPLGRRDRWCNKLTMEVTHTWLCTAYKQIDESEETR